MEFRIMKEARKWFEDIQPFLKAPPGTHSAPDFDAYYFCFLSGITEMRKVNVDIPASETAELVDYFPGPYKSRGRLLVSLFLCKELEYLGISLNERESVHSAISRLIQPTSRNFLSDEGVHEFNKYAHGGYEVLLDWFDDRPRALETFLRRFRIKVNNSLNSEIIS